MAILSAIFSLVAKQLSNILQAIFGWSITALFGKLESKKQTMLSVALILSVAWPLLVVGCFLPGVASWALAFLPLQKWLSATALRLLWIALALIVPLGVGLITRWITPGDKLHGSLAKTLLGGYVLTIAYFTAFLVTAFSVPIVKIASTAKGWDDTHVYVQPKEGRYFQVLEELGAACKLADVDARREGVPTRLALARRIIQKLARPFVEPIVAAEPQRLVAEDLEVYLYPADLLLRGEARTVARVRAMMTRTMLEQHAYLVQEPEAQDVQDQIQDLWDLYARHEDAGEIGAAAKSRLREVSKTLDCAPMTFESWTALETRLRRVERALSGGPNVLDAEAAPDMRAAVEIERRRAPDAPTTALAKQAVDEGRELARMEVALAKEEIVGEARALLHAAILFASAALAATLALIALAAVMVTALAHAIAFPIVIAAALIALAVGAIVIGARSLPRDVLPRTRERLAGDLHDVRAHVG